jgi:Kinesin-associated protein (KAP)
MHTHTLLPSHTYACTYTCTLSLPLLLSHCSPTPSLTKTHTHTHTHTPHTHAHTHTLILSLHSSLQLIQNNTVMGALTRVLQEEFKKSTELTFNILRYVRLYVQLSRRTSTSSFYCYSMIDMIVGCCTEC